MNELVAKSNKHNLKESLLDYGRASSKEYLLGNIKGRITILTQRSGRKPRRISVKSCEKKSTT